MNVRAITSRPLYYFINNTNNTIIKRSPIYTFNRRNMATDTEEGFIANALTEIKSHINPDKVRLVAVSKTKPSSSIRIAYNLGQRHFELVSKAQELQDLTEIKWHFIGHLQSNKAKQLLSGTPNLWMVETVDSKKLASLLDKAWNNNNNSKLKVFVQVNTSGEESKSGVEPSETIPLVEHIIKECNNLQFSGLMTIGSPNPSQDQPDFTLLSKLKEETCSKLNLPLEAVELSMGMSADYKIAAAMGSTNIRVGSTIFGHREYNK